MKKILFFILILGNQTFAQTINSTSGITIGDNASASQSLFIKKNANASIHFSGLNPYVTFFENNLFVGYLQNISNTFEIGSKNAANITFSTSNIHAMGFLGSTGKFYSYYPSSFADGLRAIGSLKTDYPATSGTAFQVLRSRGTNYSPVWSDFNTDPQIGFSAVRTTNFTIFSGSAPTIIDGLTLTFQDTPSTGMNNSGIFTTPSAGMYHFDVNIPFFEWTGNYSGNLVVEMYKNSVRVADCVSRFGSFGTNIRQDGLKCSFDEKLETNDQVQFMIYQSNNASANVVIPTTSLLNYQKLTISGYKIY